METKNFNNLVQQKDLPASEFGEHIGFKHWLVDKGYNVVYQNNDFHTLSFYLSGGNMNTRANQPSNIGGPNRFCFMAHSQDSTWQIRQKTEFAHLYFSPALIKRFAASTYQIDTRAIELTDQVFLEDERLKLLFLKYFSVKKTQSAGIELHIEQLGYEVLDYVIRSFNGFDIKQNAIAGGLSTSHRNQTYQQIMDGIGDKLTIAKLASAVNLSPHHFAKMFKLSFGESPASFINWVRIEKAKALLKTNTSLVEISAQLGFTHQSHMTMAFKRMLGVTPARYRALTKV